MKPLPVYSAALWWRYWIRFVASFVPPSSVKTALYGVAGIRTAPKVFIGEGVYFVDGFVAGLIELAPEAVLSPKVVVIAMAVPGDSFLQREYNITKIAPVHIGEGAWIGAGAVILPGVTIGRGAIIGANAVVTRSVGALEVWAGCPARFVKKVSEYGRR